MRKDIELAGKIGQFASRFPEEWQEYQDWLRDIIHARSIFKVRDRAWRVRLIFYWRLFYFVAYFTRVLLFNRLQKKVSHASSCPGNIFSKIERIMTQSIWSDRSRYILQRTATLLAVAELTLCGIAAITGIMLAFYYQPTAMGAYTSLSAIIREIPNGAIVLALHDIAGNGLIILALIQIAVMFFGREFLFSWFAGWMSGILLALAAIGLSWTAIVLTWEQTSFWRFKIELSIIESIPWVGSFLREVLAGGSGISTITIQHMYALHSYILAIGAILLSIVHLVSLVFQEQHWKPSESRLSLEPFCQSNNRSST
ncbi:MAG: cytochrome b N-terminal domain-containing protein [Cyanobacteriota bacterium]|nr:cytochrome b N-terminal domain-containing protein [Cyanobacteriota bacterium]